MPERIKEDEDTSGSYLQQASSLGQFSQIHGPGGKKKWIQGLGGHAKHWAAQALPLGAASPPLQPCWKAGQQAKFSREVRSLDTCVQSPDFNVSNFFFFFQKKKK